MKDETPHADGLAGAVVEGALRRPRRFETVSMGEVVGEYDLDKALELAARLEDEEIVRKLRRRR